MKLSPAMRRALQHLAEGDAEVTHLLMDRDYVSHPQVSPRLLPASFYGLLNRRLAKSSGRGGWSTGARVVTFSITDSGRRALEEG